MYKTPILREMILYSQKNSSPNQRHVDKLTEVLHRFPSKVQIGYKNIVHMSNDLQDFINTSKKALTPTPKKKFLIRSTSSRLKRNPSVGVTKTRENVSNETRNIAITLNKHKLVESNYQLSIIEGPQTLNVVEHKQICSCTVNQVDFKNWAHSPVSEGKLFISCRFAASDLPLLLENRVSAILSIGLLPNCYPMIKGGYLNLDYTGINVFKPLQQTCRFLNSKLKTGNVLVHCENGNKKSVFIVMAYLMKEMKLNFRCVYDVLKKARPFMELTGEQEVYLRRYDKGFSISKESYSIN